MLLWLGLTLLGFTAVSTFTVHQHSDNSECVNLQCPETAFDNGVKNLVNDETMKSDQCTACSQCTENGYSLCLRQKDSRAHRTATETTGFCSCAHAVPANCHNQLHISTHPANITMKLYSLCYQSAIQAPPKPLAVNEKDSVIVTIEAFWHEPYWREMQLDNLTLNYEFVVKVPEHCEGELVTLESDHLEHLCKNSLNINMTSPPEGAAKDDDYEHSENYDQYDDDLPPEVQFDRDVFSGSKLLQAYYTVGVRRPRQLDTKSSDPFRDVITTLESEHLKFDLKPEIYGDGTAELPENKKDVQTVDDDEDVSSENPSVGTDFFDDGKNVKDTKSEEETEKEEEKLEKEIADDDDKKTTEEPEEEESTTVAEEEEKDGEDKDEDEKDEADDKDEEEETENEESTTEDSEKDEEDDEDKETDEEKNEADDDEDKKEDDQSNEGEDEEKKDEDDSTTTEGEETTEEADAEENKEDDKEDDENSKEDDSDEEKGLFSSLLRDQYHVARWVFGITIASCLLLILCTCCYRRGMCCCKPNETKTTANGCRYTNANRPELVSQVPEKERLRQ